MFPQRKTENSKQQKESTKLGLEPRTFTNSGEPESNARPLRHSACDVIDGDVVAENALGSAQGVSVRGAGDACQGDESAF